MKPKHLIVLVALLVSAVTAALLVSGGNKPKGNGGGDLLAAGSKILPDFPINEIAGIRVKGANDKAAELARQEGKWGVSNRAGYPAKFEKVRSALTALSELEVAESIRAGASTLARFGLKVPEGESAEAEGVGKLTEVLDDKGKVIAALVIGDSFSGASTGNANRFSGGGGVYVRDLSREGQVFIVQNPLGEFALSPSDWLKSGSIKVTKHKQISITHSDGEQYVFSRESETDKMTLGGLDEKKEELNTTHTGSITSAFGSGSFKDVMVGDDAKPENTGLTQPLNVAIETFDGFQYDIQLGEVKPDAAEPPAAGEEPAAPTSPGPENRYFFRYEVSANLPAQRTLAEGVEETEEEKKSRDQAFATEKQALEERLAEEAARAGTIYELDKWSVEKFFKRRDELVKELEVLEETRPQPDGPPPGAATQIPKGAATPTVLPKGVEVATPPLSLEDVRREAAEKAAEKSGE